MALWPVAETRPAFDATFTQISMNHSEPGKRRPRRGGAVQWRCGPPIIVRSSGGGGFHTGTLRGHARSRRRYARVTLEFAQRTHSGFRAGENASGSDKIRRMDFTLVVCPASASGISFGVSQPSILSICLSVWAEGRAGRL